MNKILLVFIFILISWPQRVTAEENERAQRAALIRQMTTHPDDRSNSGNASSESRLQANPTLSNNAASSFYDNVYDTRTTATLDTAQSLYESDVARDRKNALEKKTREENALLGAMTTPVDDAGSRVETRIQAEQNTYLKALAKQETEKKLAALEKERAKEKPEESRETAGEAPSPIAGELLGEETEEFFTKSEKADVISRMVTTGFEPNYAASVVTVFDNKRDLKAYLRSEEDMNESEIDFILEG